MQQANDPPPSTEEYNPFAAETKKEPEVCTIVDSLILIIIGGIFL